MLRKLTEFAHATVWALTGLMVGSLFHASLRTAVILTVITAVFGCVGTG